MRPAGHGFFASSQQGETMLVNAIKGLFESRRKTKILDASMTAQLTAYLGKLQAPVDIVASLDGSEKAQEMRALLDELAQLSDKIIVRDDGHDARTPSFALASAGQPARIRFAGIPLGHEFTSLVLALLHCGGHPPKIDADTRAGIISLSGHYAFETYMTMNCHNCPEVVQALNLMAVLNPGVSHTMVDGKLFLAEIEQHQIKVVPTVFLNGQFFDQGRKTVEQYLAKMIADVI
jgi:alkyl hydroperoxide reductase subunit F